MARVTPNMTNMPTITKVFIDTNIFVAIRDINDSTHERAVEISNRLEKEGIKLYTSSDVLGETLTVLSKKLGKSVVNDWYKDFVKSSVKEIFIDEVTHRETREFFSRVKSKNVSFIDCSNVVAMKRNKIKVIFSFDEDFRGMGMKLLGDVIS